MSKGGLGTTLLLVKMIYLLESLQFLTSIGMIKDEKH